MTPSLTAVLGGTPSTPPTYNPGMAETFSWIPIEGAGRPLYAQASYIANPQDIKLVLSGSNIDVKLDEIELNTDEVENLIKTSNSQLSSFKDSVTDSQNQIISLLEQLTANTDEIEIKADSFNLNVDEVETMLSVLTGQQLVHQNKQDEIITLLHSITGTVLQVDLNTDELELNVSGVEIKQELTNTMLARLTSTIGQTLGFGVPTYSKMEIEYVPGTTDVSKVNYFDNLVSVGSLSLEYTSTGELTSVKRI